MTRSPVSRTETHQVLETIEQTLREYRQGRTAAAVERVLRTATASGRPVAAHPCVGGPDCGCQTWNYVASIPLVAGGPCKCTPHLCQLPPGPGALARLTAPPQRDEPAAARRHPGAHPWVPPARKVPADG